MNKIHPLACVSPEAKLGDNIEVGPFAFIDANVEIGDGCHIQNGATIYNHVKMGKDCTVFPGAVVGAIPQDLKFEGEESWVEIGDRVNIRECATINRGTKASGKALTRIGSDTLIMSYAHVAHDCRVGNHCILVSYSGLAGETEMEDWSVVGGQSGSHQFCRVGTHSFVAARCKITKDVPPYIIAAREPIAYCGVNSVGLNRRGFTPEQIHTIQEVYRLLYQGGMNTTQALDHIVATMPVSAERDLIVNFVKASTRGVVRA